jgi:hypothetical protein
VSHIVTIETDIRDAAAVQAACARLNFAAPVERTVELYSGRVTGLAVELPGWNYPVVCNMQTGQVRFDNFEGRWGDQAELNRFLQAYAVEKARIEARRSRHTVTEQPLEDGSIKLTVHVGGAA